MINIVILSVTLFFTGFYANFPNDPKWATVVIIFNLIIVFGIINGTREIYTFQKIMKRDMDLFSNTEVEVWKNKIKIFDSGEVHEFLNEDTEIYNHYLNVSIKSDYAGKGYIIFKSMKADKSKKISSLVFSASFGFNEAQRLFINYPHYHVNKIKLKDLKKAYR